MRAKRYCVLYTFLETLVIIRWKNLLKKVTIKKIAVARKCCKIIIKLMSTPFDIKRGNGWRILNFNHMIWNKINKSVSNLVTHKDCYCFEPSQNCVIAIKNLFLLMITKASISSLYFLFHCGLLITFPQNHSPMTLS